MQSVDDPAMVLVTMDKQVVNFKSFQGKRNNHLHGLEILFGNVLIVDELRTEGQQKPSHSETFSSRGFLLIISLQETIVNLTLPLTLILAASGHGDDVCKGIGDERMNSKGWLYFSASPKCTR